MTIRSIDSANRVLLRAFVDFFKIPAQQAYLPLSPCKKEMWADNSVGYCNKRNILAAVTGHFASNDRRPMEETGILWKMDSPC